MQSSSQCFVSLSCLRVYIDSGKRSACRSITHYKSYNRKSSCCSSMLGLTASCQHELRRSAQQQQNISDSSAKMITSTSAAVSLPTTGIVTVSQLQWAYAEITPRAVTLTVSLYTTPYTATQRHIHHMTYRVTAIWRLQKKVGNFMEPYNAQSWAMYASPISVLQHCVNTVSSVS